MYLATIFFLCLASFINLASLSGESLGDISDDSMGLLDESIEFHFQDISNEEEEEDMDSDQSSIELSSEESEENVDDMNIIDNEQVYCSWEDVKARDKMAKKLKVDQCRFSMSHQSVFEGGPNVTIFCTYKHDSCKAAQLTDKLTKARGASRTIFEDLGITGGRDDDKVYCVHNDWQSRNTVARTQGTEMNCIFSKPVKILGFIPNGRLYCCYKKRECVMSGRLLDHEQKAVNALKAKKIYSDDKEKERINRQIDKIMKKSSENARKYESG